MPKDKEFIVLFKSSKMAEDIEKVSGKLTHLKIPKDIQFSAGYEVDEEVAKVIGKDPLLQQQKVVAIQKVYEKFVKTIGTAYKECHDAIVASPLTADAKTAEIAKKRQDEMDKALTEAEGELQKIWQEYIKSQTTYSKYKTKATIKIVMDTAAFIGAVASTAVAAASFGGTAVITILALIKTGAQLARDIMDVMTKVEKAVEELKTCLENLADDCINKAREKRDGKKYVTFAGAKRAAKDVIATIEKDVVGTNFMGTLWGSLKDAKEKAKLAKQKVNGANVKAHKLAELLNTMLLKQDKLNERLKAATTSNDIEKMKKLNAKIEKNEKVVNALVVAVPQQLARFKQLDDHLNTLLKYYNEIMAQQKDLKKALKVLEVLLALKDIALAAVDATSLADAAEKMLEATKDMLVAKAIDEATEKVIDIAVTKMHADIDAEIKRADEQIEKQWA